MRPTPINPDVAELLRYNRNTAAIVDLYDRVVADVAAKHGITVARLRQRGRTRAHAAARAEACRELITFQELSTPDIARRVGYQDHTSVLHWTTLKGAERHR